MPHPIDLVLQLGDLGSADAIAALLRSRGIKGTPQFPCHCPIANYIRKESGCRVAVTCNVKVDLGNHGLEIKSPDSILEFIARFDDLQFPDLIDESPFPD